MDRIGRSVSKSNSSNKSNNELKSTNLTLLVKKNENDET